VPDSPDLRVAVLGVGQMGAYHTASLTDHTKGARVTVINDFSAERAEEISAQTPGSRVVADPFEAIGAEDVDAVLIATPGPAHEKQLLACLDRGLPVLCEKPLTPESSTSYELVRKEAALGRQLIQVGFMRRFDTEYAALRRLIADGGIGNPLLLHCTHRNPKVLPYFTAEMMINDAVVHEVDTTRFLLGEEITAVQAIKPTPSTKSPEGLSDPMMILFETESGRVVTVEIFVSTGVAYEVRTEVVGEDGSATIGLDQNLVVRSSDGRWGGRITANFVERFGAAYDAELQRWATAARSGTVDGPGVWDGYAAAAVAEAGVQAVQNGRRVEVRLEDRP
jgi:myo-inositol 2-dehydrogenase / D-chiro-inositol 1-dehydrogenase